MLEDGAYNHSMTGEFVMRVTVAVLALCASSVGLAEGARAEAAVRKEIHIPAQSLTTALQALEKHNDLRVIFVSEDLRNVRTAGASGDLTSEEAVRALLDATGLTFRYLDKETITIVPLGTPEGGAISQKRGVANSSAATESIAWPLVIQNEVSVPRPATDTRGGFWRRLRFAQNADDAPAAVAPEQEQYGEVVVTGYRFLNEDTSGTTNLPLPIEKVPQSISLISNDFLKAADIKTLGEVAQYTPGAIFSGFAENYRTYIKLRGFGAGEAVDGLPSPLNYGEYDYAVVERMEIVKGPSSVVYGAASPGGLVNIVTKKAAPNTPDYLSFTTGMWNEYRLEGQMGGTVDSEGNVNAIGVAVYEQGDSFIKVADHDRTVLYGGLDFRLTDASSAYLRGGYEKNARTSFDGVPMSADGTPAPLPRTFFAGSGDPRFVLRTEQIYVNAGIDWDVTDLWGVSFKGNYTRMRNGGMAPFASGLQENGDVSLSVEGDLRAIRDTYTAGISSVYKLDRLGLEDSFISLAALYFDTKIDSTRRWLPDFATANIFDGAQSISRIYDSVVFPDDKFFLISKDKILSYSAQTVLHLADPLTVLLGASYAGTEGGGGFGSSSDAVARYKYDGEVSYRAGVTYEVVPGLNAYLSYSESFQPQQRLDINNKPLAPLSGQQKEVGVKYAPSGARLLFTAAAFEIIQSNKPEFDQVTPLGDRYKAVGEVRHRGAEFEITGQLADRWQLHAGYAYLDPVVTKNQSEPQLVGTTITYLPKNTASLFANYKITDRFTVGAGVRHVDAVRTTFDRSTKDLPAYTIVDATAGYSWNDWMLQMNLHNLLDEKYYVNFWETTFYGPFVGEPANISVSVRRNF